jgi:hypothetical protein
MKSGLPRTWAESFILGREEEDDLGSYQNFITLFKGAFTTQHEAEDSQRKLE